MSNKSLMGLIGLLAVVIVGWNSFFVVNQTERAIANLWNLILLPLLNDDVPPPDPRLSRFRRSRAPPA